MELDVTTLGGIGAALAAGVASVWKWADKQLAECKQEHKESRARIEELHDEIKEVSTAVGELRGQLSVYKTEGDE